MSLIYNKDYTRYLNYKRFTGLKQPLFFCEKTLKIWHFLKKMIFVLIQEFAILKTNFEKISFILLTTICIICFIVLFFHAGIITTNALFVKLFNVQILLFLLCLIILTLLFIYIFLFKLPNRTKIILLLILFILQIFYLKTSFSIPTVNKIIEIQKCIDTNICEK